MKKQLILLTLIATLFCSVSAFCQVKSVDTDKKRFSFRYLRAPNKIEYYLRDGNHKYSLKGQFEPSLEAYVSAQQAEDAIRIGGWQKVWDDGKPLVKLFFEAKDLVVHTDIKTRKVVDKDKREHLYATPVAKFIGSPILYKVVDLYADKYISDSYTGYTDEVIYEYIGSECRSVRDAERNLKVNLEAQRINAEQKWFDAIVSRLSASVTSTIGWSVDNQDLALFVTDEKKFDENAANIEHYLQTRSIIESMNALDDPKGLESALAPHIEYYKSLINKYNGQDKKIDLRMRSLAYYNLAAIYFALENYTTAAGYAAKQMAVGYDSGSGKSLLKDIEKVKEYFAKKNQTSLHPDIPMYDD